MRRILLTLFALILSVGLGAHEAEARRLGGGKSIGIQRSPVTQPANTAPARGVDAPAQTARKNSWLGPVAGLAAGLGLAALASHLGLGEEFANIMLIALLAMGALLVFRLFMRKRQPAPTMQYAGMGAGGNATAFEAERVPAGAAAPVASGLPAGFDAEGFVRQAKLNFLRLQAANDAGNLDDLREFTSPELFAEIQLQLRERDADEQHTEVVDLQAEVLACVEESQRYVVSVRFFGLIREEAGAQPAGFDEVWHLTKPLGGGGGWIVSGIQQRA